MEREYLTSAQSLWSIFDEGDSSFDYCLQKMKLLCLVIALSPSLAVFTATRFLTRAGSGSLAWRSFTASMDLASAERESHELSLFEVRLPWMAFHCCNSVILLRVCVISCTNLQKPNSHHHLLGRTVSSFFLQTLAGKTIILSTVKAYSQSICTGTSPQKI